MPEDIELQGNQAGQLDNNQAANVSNGEGTQSGQPEAKYISRDEAQQLIDNALKRQKQSFNDTLSNRVKQEVDRLGKAGIQATPEQVAELINSEPEGKETPPQSSISQATSQNPAQGEGERALDPVDSQAVAWMKEDGVEDNPILFEIYKMQAQEGIHLTDADPEIEKVKQGKTIFETMQSVHAAIMEKKERLALKGSPARMPALSGGGGSARPDYSGMKGTDILDDYYSKKR